MLYYKFKTSTNLGKINVIGAGDGYIKATVGTMEDTIKFSIKSYVKDLQVGCDKYLIEVGLKLKIEPTVNMIPAGSEAPQITYRWPNNNIIKVENDGNIEALREGDTIVTVTCGDISKTIPVTVSSKNSAINKSETDNTNSTNKNFTNDTSSKSNINASSQEKEERIIPKPTWIRGAYYTYKGIEDVNFFKLQWTIPESNAKGHFRILYKGDGQSEFKDDMDSTNYMNVGGREDKWGDWGDSVDFIIKYVDL